MIADLNYELDERLKRLWKRSTDLSKLGKRNNYADNAEFLVYHFSGHTSGFSPATGEMAVGDDTRINIGDHSCRVDNQKPFPYTAEMPSKVNGYQYTQENWSNDYVFFLDHSPAEIYPDETIVGEFHWELAEARNFVYPKEVMEQGYLLRELGAGGTSLAHTCPDLSIGLTKGWGGILRDIQSSKEKWEKYGNRNRISYLDCLERVTKAIIRYTKRHAQRAMELAEKETNQDQKLRYKRIADNMDYISEQAPDTYEQAIQWIQLFQVVERINGHGNGYGRLDQLLISFYRRDKSRGILTDEEARNLLVELYLKYGGNYFSFAGRDRDGNDATNEMSWIGLQAYDMIGGYNHLGVMWHSDINSNYYRYACEVLTRHGSGVPTLVNYDVMQESELTSGYSKEDAWNVSYSGCQWYCAVGSEYSDHDLNSFVLPIPLFRAMKKAEEQDVSNFDMFYSTFYEEMVVTAKALEKFKNDVYCWQDRVWPEMVTSLCMKDCIDKGLDITSVGGARNAFTSVNVLGVPNVVDSLYAIKKVIYEEKRYTMSQLNKAIHNDWKDDEVFRCIMLNQDKYGNDLEEVDEMYQKVAMDLYDIMGNLHNIKGFTFRPSLFQFMGHTYAGPMLGATPDGRHADEPIAHGCNPMHGRNTHGLTASANSLLKVHFKYFQGGSFQIDMQPQFFDGKNDKAGYIEKFSKAYMKKGGIQINMNIIDLKQLEKAMEDPKNPRYADIVVKVTGYSAHFVIMDKEFQKEFVKRVNYNAL